MWFCRILHMGVNCDTALAVQTIIGKNIKFRRLVLQEQCHRNDVPVRILHQQRTKKTAQNRQR